MLANELKCNGTDVAATPNGTYYFQIQTGGTGSIAQQTSDLMESGGKSSWGNADVTGYVKWVKSAVTKNGTNT